MQEPLFRQQKILSISPELLTIVTLFAAGICWAETVVLNDRLISVIILFLSGIFFIFYKLISTWHSFTFYPLLGLLFFLIGHHHAQTYCTSPANPDHIFNQITDQQTVSLYGVLAEHPTVIHSPSGPKTKLLMQIKTMQQGPRIRGEVKEHKKTSGLILLSLNGLIPEKLKPGDYFLTKTKISHVNTFSTPGSFNYKKHLASKSIFLKGWIDSPSNIIKVINAGTPFHVSGIDSLLYFPERIRHHVATFIDENLSQPSRGLYKAILIGDRSSIQPSVLENFIIAGCIHILAISGMHLGLLAFITIAVLTWLLRRSTWILLHVNVQKVAACIALLPLIAYSLIAGFNIPVRRALIMTTALILAILFDRPANLINHILLAALLILALKPAAIFTASFQLSFSAVISIALIYPLLLHLLFSNNTFSLSGKSALYPISNSPPGGTQYALATIILKWFLAGITLTTAAMLGTLPLLLFHFNRISLVAPLTNLVVEPLICFWSLIIGIIACFFIPFEPSIAKALLEAGSFGLIFSENICAYFSTLPFASFHLSTPSFLEIVFYYLILLCIVMMFHLETTSKRPCITIAIFSFCSFLAVPTISEITKNSSISTSVSILDVGHGSSILLQLPHNKNIIIDGGGSGSDNFNIGERVIAPFLWKKQLKHLDAVVVSHPHSDHFNGIPFILTHFSPKELWVNTLDSYDPEYQKLLNLANRMNITIKVPENDEILFQSGNTRLLCVHNSPTTDYISNKTPSSFNKKFTTNDTSLVLRLETTNHSFLFPADISAAMANTLVSEKKILQANILLAPHHGSRSSMSLDFIESVDPKYIAISAGRNNSFNFPDKSFFDLKQKGIHVLTTGRDGTLTFTEKNKEIILSRYQVN